MEKEIDPVRRQQALFFAALAGFALGYRIDYLIFDQPNRLANGTLGAIIGIVLVAFLAILIQTPYRIELLINIAEALACIWGLFLFLIPSLEQEISALTEKQSPSAHAKELLYTAHIGRFITGWAWIILLAIFYRLKWKSAIPQRPSPWLIVILTLMGLAISSWVRITELFLSGLH